MLYTYSLDDSIKSPTLILTADHSTFLFYPNAKSSSLGQMGNASSPSSTSHSSWWSSTSSTLRELCLFVCVFWANDRKWSIIALTFCGLFLPFTASKFTAGPNKPPPEGLIKAKFRYLLHFFLFLNQTCQSPKWVKCSFLIWKSNLYQLKEL